MRAQAQTVFTQAIRLFVLSAIGIQAVLSTTEIITEKWNKRVVAEVVASLQEEILFLKAEKEEQIKIPDMPSIKSLVF